MAVAFHEDVRDELRRGTEALANAAGARFAVRTLLPEIAYRATDHLLLRGRVPVHWKTFEERARGTRIERDGVGDIDILASRDFILDRIHAASGLRLTASAGLALPTGRAVAQPFVGDVAPTPLQLGSGTVDPLLGLAVRFQHGERWSVAASGAARLVLLENRHGDRASSVVETGVGATWRVLPNRVAVDLRFEWSHLGRARVAGSIVPSSGRDALYVEPGASLRVLRAVHVGASARLPLYMRVHATQLAEDHALVARIAWRGSARARGR